MEKRFGALRAIGSIYKALGVIVLLFGIVGAVLVIVGGAAAGGGRQGLLGGAGGLLAGGVGAAVSLLIAFLISLGLYGAGEAIFVVLAIEENTRAAARNLP
jgi:hypothetical protein